MTFARAREVLERELAEKKALEAITAKFDKLREAVMDPYARAYDDYTHPPESEDGQAAKPQGPPPPAPDLGAAAKKFGLSYEKTPPLTREEAQEYGQIHDAHAGLNPAGADPMARTPGFTQVVFDAKRPLFESFDFSDEQGRRYLVWKVEDVAEHVPTLAEARPDVVAAWKTERARGPARAAAEAIKKKAEAAKGELTKETVGDRTILTTLELSRMTPASMFTGPARPREIPEVPHAGQAFREAFFDLKPGVVVVQPDAPGTTYYVMALARRSPAGFATFIMPLGPIRELKQSAGQAAQRRGYEDALASLRARAGLPADWSPPDEADRRGAGEMPDEED